MLCDYCFFYDEWYFFSNNERDLHLYGFYFGLVNVYFLVFYAITIGRHWHLSYYLIWDSSLDLHLDCLFTLYDALNYALHFHDLDHFLVLHDYLLHYYFHYFLDLLDDYVGHWDFYDLKDGLFHDYDTFDDLRDLDYLLDYSWHNHNLLYYPFNLHYSWHLNYLLHDFLYDLFLDPYNFLLHDNWDGMIDPHLLHYLLL